MQSFCEVLESGEAFLILLIYVSMEHRRHILPSSYPAHPLSLDDPSGLLRGGPRQPLTDSAGNSQSQQGQPFLGLYHHDNKEPQPRLDRPMYPTSTVPSSLQSMVPSWERHNRQTNNRRRRQHKFSRNPIVDSPHYKAYRARQNRDGNPDDAKWPHDLEIAFLDGRDETFKTCFSTDPLQL